MPQKSKIPWTDYTLNPIVGCTKNCPYCYAKKMAENPYYHKAFPNGFKPTFYPERLKQLSKYPDGSKIFICSMGELFGENEDWTYQVLQTLSMYPKLTFQILTKQNYKLQKYSPFPKNIWVGISATNHSQIGDIFDTFVSISAVVKFVSFEPLLDYTPPDLRYVNWVIIGSQTKPIIHPPIWAVENLITNANKLHIPIFIKEPLASYINNQRKEFPFDHTLH